MLIKINSWLKNGCRRYLFKHLNRLKIDFNNEQDDILAHKNVKVFVTHGGLLSCTEAIMRGWKVINI